jgi:hypothetical protein
MYVMSLSIHGIISPVSTYRRWTVDLRGVDRTRELVRGLGIWPTGM